MDAACFQGNELQPAGLRRATGVQSGGAPGQGQMKLEQAEIDRPRRKAQKLKAERDIFKKSRRLPCEGPDMISGSSSQHGLTMA